MNQDTIQPSVDQETKKVSFYLNQKNKRNNPSQKGKEKLKRKGEENQKL